MRKILNLLLLTSFLTACAGTGPTPTPLLPTLSATPLSTATVTETPAPTGTPLPTATATYPPDTTPPALPAAFKTSLLNPRDTPHTYVQEPCQYLQDKWSSQNSTPGTVLMVLMFHSIASGGITNANQTSESDFKALMQALHDNGFQAITMTQAADFLEHNAKIPERSVLLIADDRHARLYFDQYFHPYYEQWGWTVVNAWISADDYNGKLVLQDNIDLQNEGWVDHQAHGVIHNIPMGPGTSAAYATSELQGSIDFIQKNFGKAPIAIIWPGGGFTHDATLIARKLGYQLGFTTSPRGPVMFNWVPLDDTADPARPYWPQDGYVNDPLMVLPRYWDTDAIKHIPAVVQIGQDATAYAQANKADEVVYYNIVCAPKLGPLP